MLFQTPEFALLFFGTIVAFYVLAPKYRLALLAISSLTFYAASGIFDFALLLGTIVGTYLLSKRVVKDGSRWPIYVVVVMLLASLAYFKYGDFAYENARDWLGGATWVDRPSYLATILPLGISFYTFQIVGYFVDLRRGQAEHAKSFIEYVVFITFFAQLIAGPIMRGKDYLPQLRHLNGARAKDIRAGGLLILVGLVKKTVIADEIAARVDVRFSAESFSQPEAWVASALFAFQIYFDFSGYVDIALGLGRTLGIKLSENFRTPYLSTNPSEFWQRWHITLSNWFRDYLYIPLGGNRIGRSREVFNLMLVMAAAGLWHGAGWTFVIWGLIHGVYLGLQRFVPSERITASLPVPESQKKNVYNLITLAVFFNLMVLAWIPFRAPDLSTTIDMYRAIVTFAGVTEWISLAPWVVVILGLLALHWVERDIKEGQSRLGQLWGYFPSYARGSAYAGALLLVFTFSGSNQSFIYFRF